MLPETIAVKYTEEEAEYLSVRPVVRQTFRIRELVDMVLAVTGKDAGRVQQILRSGTTVFHFYRYWWQGFETDGGEIAALLAQFPDAQPARPFVARECTLIHLETTPGRMGLHLEKTVAGRRRLLKKLSLWECLLRKAETGSLRYERYAYDLHADRYVLDLRDADWAALRGEALRLAPRALRPALAALPAVARLAFFCPRV